MVEITQRDHFPSIKSAIQGAFPDLPDGAVTHASNLITNRIRRGHFDCYGIDVSPAPLADEGPCVLFAVEASGRQVYVRCIVD